MGVTITPRFIHIAGCFFPSATALLISFLLLLVFFCFLFSVQFCAFWFLCFSWGSILIFTHLRESIGVGAARVPFRSLRRDKKHDDEELLRLQTKMTTSTDGLGSLTTIEDLRIADEITSKPPFIQIPNLDNFRDIGGWDVNLPSFTSQPSPPIRGRVRSKIMYRSPDLGSLTSEGEKKIKQELGVKTVIDLRSVPQIVRAGGVREIDGVRRVWAPVFEVGMYSPERAGQRYLMYCGEGEGIVAAFEEIMTHGAKASFAPLLRHLASMYRENGDGDGNGGEKEGKGATIIHCTTGNNRSGVFIALLLSLLGVPDEQVADDYALSQYGLTRSREATIDRLMKNKKFVEAIGTGEEGRRKALGMVGARRGSMLAFLERVRERWGSVERWAEQEVGVEEEVLGKVRGVLVDGF